MIMKKITIALILFTLSLSFSACRKIKFEEGDKLPRRKFLETINGVWEIKHGYKPLGGNIYSEDSVSFWNTRFGGVGTVTIDYFNSIKLNWGNHEATSLFVSGTEEDTYTYFDAGYKYTDELARDTGFAILIGQLPFSYDVSIMKLDKNNLWLRIRENDTKLELQKK
jgi:hypothetical protein